MIAAIAKDDNTNAMSATRKEFIINPAFSRVNLRSRAASRTIITSPTLPIISKVLSVATSEVSYFPGRNSLIITPKAINIKTLGIFVFFAKILKKKEMMITEEIPMISVYVSMLSI